MWKGQQISFSESLSRILPAIANRIEEKMPEMGKFSPMPYYFDVKAKYIKECVITFDYDSQRFPEGRIVQFGGLFPDGSGRRLSHYVFWGTKKERLQYLRAPERVEEFLKTVQQLDQAIKIHD